jgi:hypothetical protein
MKVRRWMIVEVHLDAAAIEALHGWHGSAVHNVHYRKRENGGRMRASAAAPSSRFLAATTGFAYRTAMATGRPLFDTSAVSSLSRRDPATRPRAAKSLRPHYDSDRERSGIISVERAALSRLIRPNERLNIAVLPDRTICLD